MSEHVLNVSQQGIQSMFSLSKRGLRTWLSTCETIKPVSNAQYVTVDDSAAAKELISKGLLKPVMYLGKKIPGRYTVPRAVAFCTEEPTIEEMLSE